MAKRTKTPEQLTQPPATPLQRFGADVRRVRLGRNLLQRHVARATGYSESYVSQVESGKKLASMTFAVGCDRTFGTNGLIADLLARLDDGEYPSWFGSYLDLERKALQILNYSSTFIMGMLQTSEYAEATLRAGSPRADDEQIASKVAARIRRHESLEGRTPPLVWVVLHEACLRTVVGGRAVMARQLDHLVAEAASPDVTLQVLPFKAGSPAADNAFTLLTFADSPTVLYSDGVQGGRVHDAATVVAGACETFDRLRAHALSPDDALGLIDTVAKEYRREQP